ncbi:MAG: VWA domain-containing protein [bacterium]
MNDLAVQYPWAFLLLALIPAVIYARKRLERRTDFSGIFLISGNLRPGGVRSTGRDVLCGLFLGCSAFAVANIQYSSYWQRTYLESKWIMLVQDLSGSMNRPSGEGRMTLGDVALAGAREFVELRGKDDLIGVVAFSSYAKLVCPPTFDRAILKSKLGMLGKESDSPVFRQLSVGGATNASYASWVALCVFFMLLPEESQLSFEELDDLRFALLGKTLRQVSIPEELKRINFGHGMALVVFTDGRIEPNKSEEDVRKGIPNFVNVLGLTRQLGVRVYLISVTGEVNREIESAFEDGEPDRRTGQIFYMSGRFDRNTIEEVYRRIDDMEKNRLLTQLNKRKRDTRWMFALAALCSLCVFGLLEVIPRYRRIG